MNNIRWDLVPSATYAHVTFFNKQDKKLSVQTSLYPPRSPHNPVTLEQAAREFPGGFQTLEGVAVSGKQHNLVLCALKDFSDRHDTPTEYVKGNLYQGQPGYCPNHFYEVCTEKELDDFIASNQTNKKTIQDLVDSLPFGWPPEHKTLKFVGWSTTKKTFLYGSTDEWSDTEYFVGTHLDFVLEYFKRYKGTSQAIEYAVRHIGNKEIPKDAAYVAIALYEQTTWISFGEFEFVGDNHDQRLFHPICTIEKFKEHLVSKKPSAEPKWKYQTSVGKCNILNSKPNKYGAVAVQYENGDLAICSYRTLKAVKPQLTAEERSALCKFSKESNDFNVINAVEAYLSKHETVK